MKSILSTILLWTLCLSLQAKTPPLTLRISDNRIYSAESIIWTSRIGIGLQATKPTAKTGEEEVIWRLVIRFHQDWPIGIREDSDFLTLTLFDNTQLKLRPAFNVGQPYAVLSPGYSYKAFYTVTQEQMEKLINSGVASISLANTLGTYDRSFKKDKIGLALNEMRLVIETAIDEL